MFIVNFEERTVLSKRLMSLGAPGLMRLVTELFGEDALHMQLQQVAASTAQVMGRIGHSVESMIATCEWLRKEYPYAPENPSILAIIQRLERQIGQRTRNPIDEIWIGSEPVVNRHDLRQILRDICEDGFDHGVVYVAGGTASGRTHSKHLIRHVGLMCGIRCHFADFQIETEARTITHLFHQLRAAYRLPTLDVPITEGFGPADTAARFLAKLRVHLLGAEIETPPPWIIIDYTDDVVDPAVADFIAMLCSGRLKNDFVNGRLFVLGSTEHLASLGDEPSIQVEELGPLTREEIASAAEMINQRATKPLTEVIVGERVDAIVNAARGIADIDRNARIRRMLLDLRREVRAP